MKVTIDKFELSLEDFEDCYNLSDALYTSFDNAKRQLRDEFTAEVKRKVRETEEWKLLMQAAEDKMKSYLKETVHERD